MGVSGLWESIPCDWTSPSGILGNFQQWNQFTFNFLSCAQQLVFTRLLRQYHSSVQASIPVNVYATFCGCGSDPTDRFKDYPSQIEFATREIKILNNCTGEAITSSHHRELYDRAEQWEVVPDLERRQWPSRAALFEY